MYKYSEEHPETPRISQSTMVFWGLSGSLIWTPLCFFSKYFQSSEIL